MVAALQGLQFLHNSQPNIIHLGDNAPGYNLMSCFMTSRIAVSVHQLPCGNSDSFRKDCIADLHSSMPTVLYQTRTSIDHST